MGREIAERMGFTKAALYYHFRTKDDLLVELLAPLLEASRAVMDKCEQPLDTAASRRVLLQRYLQRFERANRRIRSYPRCSAIPWSESRRPSRGRHRTDFP